MIQLMHRRFVCSVCHYCNKTHTHTHTIVLLLFWNLSRTTQVSRYQKGKINLDLLEQEIVSGSSMDHMQVCTLSQITIPTSHHSVFTGRMPFLLPNQQHQSTEGIIVIGYEKKSQNVQPFNVKMLIKYMLQPLLQRRLT